MVNQLKGNFYRGSFVHRCFGVASSIKMELEDHDNKLPEWNGKKWALSKQEEDKDNVGSVQTRLED
jgi:hypothetical protein